MACTSPKIRILLPSGQAHFFGSYDHYAIARRSAPSYKFANAKLFELPCGNCHSCMATRQKETAFRISKDVETAANARDSQSFFLTLTYAPEHLPEGGLLNRDHLKTFLDSLKRMQARTTGKPLRYFAVGEYGTESLRAHYHAILIGLNLPEDKQPVGGLKDAKGFDQYEAPYLEKLWKYGQIFLTNAHPDNATYVAKYAQKQNFHKIYRVDAEVAPLLTLDPATDDLYKQYAHEAHQMVKQQAADGVFPFFGSRGKAAQMEHAANSIAYERWLRYQKRIEYLPPSAKSHLNQGFVGSTKSSRKNRRSRHELRYIIQNITTGEPLAKPLEMIPEFAIRTPGLGGEWIKSNFRQLYDQADGLVMERGQVSHITCRYMDRLYAQEHGKDSLQAVKDRRSTKSITKELQRLKNDGRTPEEIALVRLEMHKLNKDRFKDKSRQI